MQRIWTAAAKEAAFLRHPSKPPVSSKNGVLLRSKTGVPPSGMIRPLLLCTLYGNCLFEISSVL